MSSSKCFVNRSLNMPRRSPRCVSTLTNSPTDPSGSRLIIFHWYSTYITCSTSGGSMPKVEYRPKGNQSFDTRREIIIDIVRSLIRNQLINCCMPFQRSGEEFIASLNN